jgi:universal stress protein A
MKLKKSNRLDGLHLESGLKKREIPSTTTAPTIPLKKILVPVDFSERSRKAVQYALTFAAESKAELLFVHIVEPYIPPPDIVMVESAALESIALRAAKKYMRQLVAESEPVVSCKSEIRIGKPWVEIIKLAKETDTDLIVVSTHGRTGFAHLLMGSTAEQIVRHAGCPVLVVRQTERDFVT